MDFWVIYRYILTALLGLCVGSFLNVVIYRIPKGMSLASPPSHCPRCGERVRWYDNIPVVSFALLGGRCRTCREPISPRYLLVELSHALLWLLTIHLVWDTSPVLAILYCFAISLGYCIFFIDLSEMYIPDRFTIGLAILGILAIFFDPTTEWWEHLIGAAVGGIGFLAIYLLALLILKKEGIGLGDVKLMGAIGLLLGWQKTLFACLIFSVVGSVVLILLNRLSHSDREREYPFGPFIMGGTLVAMLFGDAVIGWYLGLLLG